MRAWLACQGLASAALSCPNVDQGLTHTRHLRGVAVLSAFWPASAASACVCLHLLPSCTSDRERVKSSSSAALGGRPFTFVTFGCLLSQRPRLWAALLCACEQSLRRYAEAKNRESEEQNVDRQVRRAERRGTRISRHALALALVSSSPSRLETLQAPSSERDSVVFQRETCSWTHWLLTCPARPMP